MLEDDAVTTPAIELASRPAADGTPRIGVDYVFSEGQHLFWMWEGNGPHAMSTPCAAADALARWRPHLAAAGAMWLVPWLTRLAEGEAIEPAEILVARIQQAPTR